MKIKTKKQLNLPQLIEWGFEQKELPPLFYGSREGSLVQFTPGGWVNITGIEATDTFTIEVEEEITEDTRLDKLVVRYRNDDIYIFPQERINDFKNDSSIIAFYIPNDDLTMTLIWRDGKLVE